MLYVHAEEAVVPTSYDDRQALYADFKRLLSMQILNS